MTWFAASIIVTTRPIDDSSGPIFVHENIVLFEGKDSDGAYAKATEYANAAIVADDTLTLDDKPAVESFAGIRKLISISNPHPLDQDKDPPTTGTEITYSCFEVANDQDLAKLVQGEDVVIRYIE